MLVPLLLGSLLLQRIGSEVYEVIWAARASEGHPGVERPYIEAEHRPRILSSATYLFFTYEEIALVAARYIEGHALTLCIYTVTV